MPTGAVRAASGPKLAVAQKLINFRLQDQISVQGSGFTPGTYVTVSSAPAGTVSVDLTTNSANSAPVVDSATAQVSKQGSFSVYVKTVDCPSDPNLNITYQASAGGITSAVATPAC
jgi:hypothetical protein